MTGVQKLLIATALTSLLFLGQGQVEAVKLEASLLENRYNLTWEVNSTTIFMEVVAQTTGWVGLGFNANNSTMLGSELLIGGIINDTVPYFHLYHGIDHNIEGPKEGNEWKMISITENAENNVTTMAVTRSLKRANADGNSSLIDFEDKKIFILFSMAADGNDDPAEMEHSARGVVEVNPLEVPKGGGGASSGIPSILTSIALLIVAILPFHT